MTTSHRARRLSVALLLAAAITACGAASEPLSVTLPTGTPVSLGRFRADGPYSFAWNSGYTTSRRLVIRDAAAWSAAWATIWQHSTPVPALPAVDFTREMVVLASLGQRNSGGYAILVDSAVATGSEVVVRVRSSSPGPRCFTTSALTEPVDIVRMPATSLPVTFAEYDVVVNCE